ncbi:MAG: replicative DNA helicase [Planctomycetota bacterium]
MLEDLTPPNDPEIERSVLGEMVFDVEALDIAIEELLDDAFYRPNNSIVFNAIKSLRLENKPADQLSITEELRKCGNLEKIGGEQTIAGICSAWVSAANIKSHIDILNEKANKRKLIGLTNAVHSMCYEDGGDVEEIASILYLKATEIIDKKKEVPYRSFAEIIRDAHEWIIRKSEQSGTMGISTGLSRLDKYTDGWQDGKLYILAGKTGQGKSALAINSFVLNAAKHGVNTGVFSLEMGDIEIGVRSISGEARMDLSSVQYNKPKDEDWVRISDACARLYSLPIVIDETPGISIAQIGSKIRRMQRDKGVKLVIVDYLQLMGGKESKSREQEVGSISRGLKLLAKSLHIPIIAISQLSRKAGDENEYIEPQLSFLRESGSLEMDADMVIFIHEASDETKQGYNINGDKENIREIIIRKHRGGKTGKIYAIWRPEFLSFYDVEY